MYWRVGLALVVTIGLLLGCSGKPVGIGGKPRDKAYANVVSLSPSTTDFLISLGGSIYLVGRSAGCDRPEQIQNLPVVVAQTQPDYEKILSLDPDLIIYDKSLYGEDEVAKIKQLGVDVLEYDPRTLDDYMDFGYRLGSKLALETYASTHLDTVFRAFESARASTTTKPRTTVLLGPDEGKYYVMGLEGFHAYILQACGATPVGVAGDLFQEAKIESLLDWDPEVIYSDGRAQQIYADPRLQQVAAIKNQRVFDYDERDLVRIGGKLDGIVGQFTKDLERMPINARKGASQ